MSNICNEENSYQPLKRFLIYYLPVLLWILVIFFLSVITVPSDISYTLPLFPHKDKVAHFVMYGVFAFLLLRALNSSGKDRSNLKIKVIIIAFSYGVMMEIVQYFIPARSFEVMDIVANGFGAVGGQMFLKRKISSFKGE